MRRFVTSLLIMGLLTVGFAAVNAGEMGHSSWFDLENCAMCNHLQAEEGLLEHMNWESHVIGTGMLSITTVAEGYEEKYKTARGNMMQTVKRLEEGEEMPLCGMCKSYGSLHATGKVNWEKIDSEFGHISLLTSTDPDVIAKIQAHAQTTIDEYKKMLATQTAAK